MTIRNTLSAVSMMRREQQRRVLRRLVSGGPATTATLSRDLAARLRPGDASRCVDALSAEGLIANDCARPPVWSATAAGIERDAAWRSEKKGLPMLPVPFTEGAALDCGRRGVILTVAQCAAAWNGRTLGDLPCARGEDGALERRGCPVGAEAADRIREREEASLQAKKERRACA